MTLGERVWAVLGVQRDEARLVRRMLLLYFVLIAALVLIQSMAFGLFIAEFGSARLPYAYLAIAGLASVVSFAYLRLAARVSFQRLLTVNLAFLALGSLVLWLGLRSPLAGAATFLLPVWFQIFVTLANLVVWPLAMRLFDVRQGKRVFGLIGAGNWIANMLGGLVVAPLVALLGTIDLLALAAVVVVGAWLLLRGIARDHLQAAAGEPSGRAAETQRPKAPLGSYAWRIFAYTAAWWLAFYFVDNLFYAQAGAQYPDAESLTAFIGRFLSVTGAVALFTTVVLTSRVLRRFGLGAGLLTLPVLVTAAVAAVAFGGTLGLPAVMLFWLATSAKLSNVAFGFSLSQTSHNVMYQALEGRTRERVQTLAEGVVQPIAIGVAGAALLFISSLLGLSSVGLAWVLTPLGLVWIVLTLRVSAAYPHALAGVLKRRRWGEGPPAPLDAAALSLLTASLEEQRPGPVLFALGRLEPRDADLGEGVWRHVLAHPVSEVRAEAVARLATATTSGMPNGVRLLEERLAAEPEPPVMANLLRTLSGLGSARAIEAAALALNAPEPAVHPAAIASLIRYGGVDQSTRGQAALDGLLASASPAQRALAARALGELVASGEHVALNELAALGKRAALGERDAGGEAERWEVALSGLLTDADADVRRAALSAVPPAGSERLWAAVLRAAATPGSARHAERALAAGGAGALAAAASLVERGGLPEASLLAAARAAAKVRGPKAAELLSRLVGEPLASVRHAALVGLATGSAEPQGAAIRRRGGAREAATTTTYPTAEPGDRTATVAGELERSSANLRWLGDLLTALPAEPAAGPLAAALRDSWQREQDTVLLLAALASGADAMLDARDSLAAGDPGSRARALEVVELNLPVGFRASVLPLLEKAAPAAPSLQGGIGLLPTPVAATPERRREWPTGFDERLPELIVGRPGRYFGGSVRAGALHLVGALGLSEHREHVERAAAEPQPLVAETARWALRRLGPITPGTEERMLSTIERAIVLKGAQFFAGAPHEVLLDVAELLEEVEVLQGEDVVRRGEEGDSLYVVVEGSLSVREGERELEALEPGAAFGEMAILDPGPRSATVTATSPARLLRLSRAPFIDLVHQRPEVALGIMEVLVRRLRSRVSDLYALDLGLSAEGLAGRATGG